MLTMHTILLLLFLGIQSTLATISCTYCTTPIHINLTSDTDLNTHGCTLYDAEICTLKLRIDYTNVDNNFADIDGILDGGLILTNGEPELTETTSIWFDALHVRRLANILCFSASSCGFDLLKSIYRDNYRLFNYTAIQSNLSAELYSSAASNVSLTCANPFSASLSCPNGFCRASFDGNGFLTSSSCVTKGFVSPAYGLTVTKTTMVDLNIAQASIIFTCNKPMCNSNENIQKVFEKLIEDGLLPPTMVTTTTATTTATVSTASKTTTGFTVPTTTSDVTISTTMVSMGVQLLNKEQKLFVLFVILFQFFK